MSPLLLRTILPWLAVAAAVAVGVVFARVAGRRLLARPALLALAVIGSLLPLYLALAWTGLVPETFLRVARPAVAIGTAALALFVAHRLASDPTAARKGRVRLVLSDVLTGAALLAAGGAAAGVEIGRPLDRLTVIVAVDRSRRTRRRRCDRRRASRSRRRGARARPASRPGARDRSSATGRRRRSR